MKNGLNYAPGLGSASAEKLLKKIWTFFLMLYIVCSITFFSGTYYVWLSTLSLYSFLAVSAVCMLLRYRVQMEAYFIGLMIFGALLIAGAIYS